MKKGCWSREKIGFDRKILVSLFILVLIISVNFVNVMAATSAQSSEQPLDQNKPEDWYKSPQAASDFLKKDPAKFFEKANGMESTSSENLWNSLLIKGDKEAISKILENSDLNNFWSKKISSSSKLRTIQSLKESGKLDSLIGKLSNENNLNFLKVAYTEIDSRGEKANEEGKKYLEAVRKDFLLAVSKSKEANKIYVSLYKSMFEGGDVTKGLTEAGKAGLKNLENAFKVKGMENVREAFVKAIVHDLIKDLKNSDGKPYAGLQEFKLAKDFSLGFDDNGKPVLKYQDKVLPIDIENAQIWSNKINAGIDGLKFEKKDGTTLTIDSKDLVNLKSMKWDIKTGEININGMSFNPYARDNGVTRAEHWKLSISENKVVITGDQKVGWVRVGDKFFTYNRENPGAFSVALEKKGEQVISYGQKVDAAVLLGVDHWKDPKASPKAISFRTTGDQGVAFFGIGEKVLTGLATSGYISVSKVDPGSGSIPGPGSIPIPYSSTVQPNVPFIPTSCGSQGCTPGAQQVPPTQQTQIKPDYLVTLNGVSNAQVIGTYAGTEKYSMAVTGSNVEVSRFNSGNQVYISSGKFIPVPYSDQPAGGFVINPDLSQINLQSTSGQRYAQVLASAGIQVPGYTPILTDSSGGQGGAGTQGAGAGTLNGFVNPNFYANPEQAGTGTQPNPGQEGAGTGGQNNPALSPQQQQKVKTLLNTPGVSVIGSNSLDASKPIYVYFTGATAGVCSTCHNSQIVGDINNFAKTNQVIKVPVTWQSSYLNNQEFGFSSLPTLVSVGSRGMSQVPPSQWTTHLQ